MMNGPWWHNQDIVPCTNTYTLNLGVKINAALARCGRHGNSAHSSQSRRLRTIRFNSKSRGAPPPAYNFRIRPITTLFLRHTLGSRGPKGVNVTLNYIGKASGMGATFLLGATTARNAVLINSVFQWASIQFQNIEQKSDFEFSHLAEVSKQSVREFYSSSSFSKFVHSN